MATVLRWSRTVLRAIALATLAAACGNQTARAPVPTAYDWPDSLAYRITVMARAMRDTQTVASFVDMKTLKFRVRYDGSYSVWHDSMTVIDSQSASPPVHLGPQPEDTLHYIVQLSRWGEFLAVVPACDPALPRCHDVAPSALQFELRDLIPQLPVWWPPRGHAWEDTLWFDDSPRRWGERGSVASVYGAMRDTVAGGGAYWVVAWRSVRRAFDWGPRDTVAVAPVAETGTVYVDKRLLVPAFAEWRSTLPARGVPGATRIEVRGRAVLAGSVFDSRALTQEGR